MAINPPPMNPQPEGAWMRRLRESMQIWLVKEQEYARVAMPWFPDPAGHRVGKLVIYRTVEREDGWHRGPTEVWYVGSRGEGLDGGQLILPCEGHLPEELATVVDQIAIDNRAVMAMLLRRIEVLERRMAQYDLRAIPFPSLDEGPTEPAASE